MTLKEQIEEIAIRWISPEWFAALSPPEAVNSLCAKAFAEQIPEGRDTRALRAAYIKYRSPGWIEPGTLAVE